jgi:hypothetical protein
LHLEGTFDAGPSVAEKAKPAGTSSATTAISQTEERMMREPLTECSD